MLFVLEKHLETLSLEHACPGLDANTLLGIIFGPENLQCSWTEKSVWGWSVVWLLCGKSKNEPRPIGSRLTTCNYCCPLSWRGTTCPGIAEVLDLTDRSERDCGFVHGEQIWEKRGFQHRIFFLPEHETETSLALRSLQREMTSSLQSELFATTSSNSWLPL